MLMINETSAKGADKIKLYGWKIADAPGQLRTIDKALLQVDETYQRDVKDRDVKVYAMASQWSWVACGVLIIGHRNGTFFVIDGQNRLRAALKRSDIRELPCIVFETSNTKQEAEGFLRANKHRKPMTAIQAFKASVTAGDEVAIFVAELVAKRGCVVRANQAGSFAAPGVLMQIASHDRDRATRAFNLAADICLPDIIHSEIIRGLAFLDARLASGNISEARIRSRLCQIGRSEILRSIAAAKASRRVSGDRVRAEGILNALNHKLRNKIEANL
jgi:hypothetical protein